MEELRRFLQALPDGLVGPPSVEQLAVLLSKCWDEFSIEGDDGGMQGFKLHDRMKKVEWRDPELDFQIDRHGGTVLGSTRAKIQQWTLNTTTCCAKMEIVGQRQVRNPQPRLAIDVLVERVARLIREHRPDKRLEWLGENKVKVLIRIIIPENGPIQTLRGRRKRFWKALDARLAPQWIRQSALIYVRDQQ